ncbi:Uma2 family endonuclease [Accumulibacter sp.]|uniref:Uma2 family endonuclease n=1 Tax=Accumulibacter sp. TaxID=2053492 RepID=UPI0025EECB4E|nr:Uma2 family endonuclease [Accumulibacter sp.]MCM8613748.1 Uma2 family endonuclease [Accumulibacter sp.]MCM8637975.1 Uma2 family endonuclease [Accumulibacter sp.]MCM8641312.1 Uma2 family endonuclease [Accumulibacter sp.]
MAYMSELLDRARHRISVDDHHRMADAGVCGHQDRVEPIAGEVFDIAPIGSQHAYVVNQLARLFTLTAGQDCLVSTQNPIRLDERSEPQPDLALLKPGGRDVSVRRDTAPGGACRTGALAGDRMEARRGEDVGRALFTAQHLATGMNAKQRSRTCNRNRNARREPSLAHRGLPSWWVPSPT